MSEINDEIKQLEHIRDNVLKDDNLKTVIDDVIELKQKEDSIDEKVEQFIRQFEEDLDTEFGDKKIVEKAPILKNLYNNYIQNLFTTSPTYQKTLHIRNQLQDQLEKLLTEEQIILLKQIDYCDTRLHEDLSDQIFIYGFSLNAQMQNEAKKKLENNETE